MSLILTVSARAQKPPVAANQLRQSNSTVEWDFDSVKVADVDCDGRPDTIVLGAEQNNVVIGVVSGSADGQPQVLRFHLGRDTQDGFCALPKTIKVSPLKCDSDGGNLPGCKEIKGCKEFSVPDGECDSFNFYWDATHRTVAWWRR
jgi:hypothetical protein